MAIVVEDGTGSNPDANSYSSLADIRSYALARGVALPADDDALGALVLPAMDWIEALGPRFKGKIAHPYDPLQWPRAYAVINGSLASDDALPIQLRSALAQLCMDQFGGVNLFPVRSKWAVQSEKVDVLEVKYATGGTTQPATLDPLPSLVQANALLAPLLRSGGGVLTTFRA